MLRKGFLPSADWLAWGSASVAALVSGVLRLHPLPPPPSVSGTPVSWRQSGIPRDELEPGYLLLLSCRALGSSISCVTNICPLMVRFCCFQFLSQRPVAGEQPGTSWLIEGTHARSEMAPLSLSQSSLSWSDHSSLYLITSPCPQLPIALYLCSGLLRFSYKQPYKGAGFVVHLPH